MILNEYSFRSHNEIENDKKIKSKHRKKNKTNRLDNRPWGKIFNKINNKRYTKMEIKDYNRFYFGRDNMKTVKWGNAFIKTRWY